MKIRYFWKEKFYYIDFYKDNLGKKFTEFEIQPKTSTFMLSTDLKDMNGKEVYQGDVLADKPKKCSPVKFVIIANEYSDNEEYGWILESVSLPCDRYILDMQTIKILEIVGNVYENPELFEEKKERVEE